MNADPSNCPTKPESPQGVLRLDDWGVVMATGADAATFLHGQLTQDIVHLGASEARLAGYCSAKGRLLATFVVWRSAPDSIALACSADLLAPTLKRLSMFVLRAQCRLSDASAAIALYGLAGAGAQAWIESLGSTEPESVAPWGLIAVGDHRLIRLPDALGTRRWLLAQPSSEAPPPLPRMASGDWAALEVGSGVARVTAATVEHFVPQMVNLELTGGVNFQKGCYPGQEVVARSQYRGTLKRRMARVESSGDTLAPGQDVFHDSDPAQPAGEVVLVASPSTPAGHGNSPMTGFALVSVKTERLSEAGHLRAGKAVLRVQPLPYAVPTQAE